jgi:hypothetical protein
MPVKETGQAGFAQDTTMQALPNNSRVNKMHLSVNANGYAKETQ